MLWEVLFNIFLSAFFFCPFPSFYSSWINYGRTCAAYPTLRKPVPPSRTRQRSGVNRGGEILGLNWNVDLGLTNGHVRHDCRQVLARSPKLLSEGWKEELDGKNDGKCWNWLGCFHQTKMSMMHLNDWESECLDQQSVVIFTAFLSRYISSM